MCYHLRMPCACQFSLGQYLQTCMSALCMPGTGSFNMQRSQIYICAGREASGQPPSEPKARLLAVVPEGAPSPLGRQVAVTSEDVMRHMARRLAFADPGFHLEVFTDAELQVGDKPDASTIWHSHYRCQIMSNMSQVKCVLLQDGKWLSAQRLLQPVTEQCWGPPASTRWQAALTHHLCVLWGAQEPVVLRDFEREARRADILFVEGLQDAAAVEAVLRSAPGVPTLVAFGCAPALRGAQRLGGLPLAPAGCAH